MFFGEEKKWDELICEILTILYDSLYRVAIQNKSIKQNIPVQIEIDATG